MKILLHIIEEEVDLSYEKLISEDYDDFAGNDASTDSGKGGLSRFWRDRGQFPGLVLSPAMDVISAFKKAGAKASIAIAGLIGMGISSAIAALLPFNDPRAVTWIGKKFLAWETKSMKFIDEQFKTETEKMRQGWETFKGDFWGIGFVAAPFGAIAAAMAASKGIDMAASVGNVVTGGKLGALLNKINLDVEDPGDLDSYLRKGTEEKKREREKELEKEMYSARCIANLDDPNWLDPECLGFADRSMFPAGDKGQRDFIDFVTRNASDLQRIRRDRYKVDFGREPVYHRNDALSSQNIINALRDGGYLTESNKVLEEQTEPQQKNETGLSSVVSNALKGPAPKKSVAEIIAEMKKKFGPEKTEELLKQIIPEFLKNPEAQASERQWVAKNLPIVASNLFGTLNRTIVHRQVPGITMEQVQEYNKNAGDAAVKAIVQSAKSKNIQVPAESLAIAKQAVDATVQKGMAPLIALGQEQAQQQTATPQAPQAPVPNVAQKPVVQQKPVPTQNQITEKRNK